MVSIRRVPRDVGSAPAGPGGSKTEREVRAGLSGQGLVPDGFPVPGQEFVPTGVRQLGDAGEDNQRLQEAFDTHGTITRSTISDLDWPEFPRARRPRKGDDDAENWCIPAHAVSGAARRLAARVSRFEHLRLGG